MALTKVKGSVWDADNTYTPTGTSTASRTLQSKLDMVVSLDDYTGADATGATDSTTALTNAIADVDGVGTVLIPQGTFVVEGVTSPSTSLRLVGEGKDLSILKQKDASTTPIFNITSRIETFSMRGIGVDGNESTIVDPNRTIQHMVIIADDVYISDCDFYNGVRSNLRIKDLANVGRIENCSFRDHSLWDVDVTYSGTDTLMIHVTQSTVGNDSLFIMRDCTLIMPDPTALSNTYATDVTGDTDGSTATITGMTDTSDFDVDSPVSVSAGFSRTDNYFSVQSKTATSITLYDITGAVSPLSDSVETNVTVTQPTGINHPSGITINGDEVGDKDTIANQRCIIENNYFENLGLDENGPFAPHSSPLHCYKNGSDSVIRGNIINKPTTRALRWQKSDNVIIEGNIIRGGAAYFSDFQSAIEFEGRTADTTVRKMEGVIIRNNHVSDMGDTSGNAACEWGIRLNADDGAEIERCDVVGNVIDGTGGGVFAKHIKGSIRVNDNTFSNFTLTDLGVENFAVYIAELDKSTTNVKADVCGNYFYNCYGRALRTAGATTSLAYFTVRDNYAEQVSLANTAKAAFDVRDVEEVYYDNNTLLEGTGGTTIKYEKVTTPSVDRAVGPTPVACINYSGTGTTIDGAHNIDTITRNVAGDYTFTFVNPIATNAIPVISTAGHHAIVTALSTTAITVKVYDTGDVLLDATAVYVAIFQGSDYVSDSP